MNSYTLNTFGPQLQEILYEAQKHLGKNIIFSWDPLKIKIKIKIKINFLYLDKCRTCERNGGPAKESIDHKFVWLYRKRTSTGD